MCFHFQLLGMNIKPELEITQQPANQALHETIIRGANSMDLVRAYDFSEIGE